MKPMTGNRRIVLTTLLGASFGYLVLHPYTMVVYELHGAHVKEGGSRGAVRRFEEEKRLLAAETVRQLTVTLSHHLLNAVQGIGGFAASVIRKEQDDDLRRRVERIRDEARRIEAVVTTLQSLETVATEPYIGSSETMMIDIRNEIRGALSGDGTERKP